MDSNVGADVVIYEPVMPGENVPVVCPYRVLVNGTDVGLIEKGSVKINPGDADEVATVTLTLQIKSLRIVAE